MRCARSTRRRPTSPRAKTSPRRLAPNVMAATASPPTGSRPTWPGSGPPTCTWSSKPTRRASRSNAEMTEKVKFLSEDAIVKVAAYYASLDPAQPPAAPARLNSTPSPPARRPQRRARMSRRQRRQPEGRRPQPRRPAPSISSKPMKPTERRSTVRPGNEERRSRRSKRLQTTKTSPMSRCTTPCRRTASTRAQTPAQGDAAVGKDSLVALHQVPRRGRRRRQPVAELGRSGLDLPGQSAARLQGRQSRRRHDGSESQEARRRRHEESRRLLFQPDARSRPGITRPLTPDQWAENATVATAPTATARDRKCRRSPRSAWITCRRSSTNIRPARARARRWRRCRAS